MNRNWFYSLPNNAVRGLDIIRITIAIILSVHGTHGLLHPERINGLGEYLSSIGFPVGIVLAWLIIVMQILCSVALIVQRMIVPACLVHITILAVGIGLIHASEGWFVVGGGRNGMEFSFTLIFCLIGIIWAYWPRTN